MEYASQTSAPPTPGKLASGPAIAETLEQKLADVFILTDRLSLFADRLIGTRPEAVTGTGDPVPQPQSLDGRLHEIARRIDKIGFALNATVLRLESFV